MTKLASVLVFRNGAICAFDELGLQIHSIQAFNISDLILGIAKSLGVEVCKELRITLPGPVDIVREVRQEERQGNPKPCKTTKKKNSTKKTRT